jgi:catechol 2,3-dioxygenase-like lactoylglutathione lyase family enzyme
MEVVEMLSPKSGVFFLKTRDLEETTRFYTRVLGFELVLDQKKCRIFKVCQNCYLGFCLTEGDTGSEEVIVTFEREDVDGFCQYLEEMNVPIEIRPRLNQTFNIYQMFIRDPNGYLLEIQRFLDPSWDSG